MKKVTYTHKMLTTDPFVYVSKKTVQYRVMINKHTSICFYYSITISFRSGPCI